MRASINLRRGSILVIAAFASISGATLLLPRVHFVRDVNAATTPAAKTTPTTLAQPEMVQRYQQFITPEAMSARLHFLASDQLEGRETTTRGQKLAAQYLASQYREFGAKPVGKVDSAEPYTAASYFQPFNVYRRTPQETQLDLYLGGKQVASSKFSPDSSDDLSYFLSGGLKNSSGGVIFAGYGIGDDALGYNDYSAIAAKGLSVDGMWLLILDNEPQADATTSLLPTKDHKLSKWVQFPFKRKAALVGKPLGFLVVTDSIPGNKLTFSEESAQASRNARRVGGLLMNEPVTPTAFAVSTRFANQLLAPYGQTVDELRNRINRNLKPEVFEIANANVSARVEASAPLQTENVVAFIEGSDPVLKDEVLIVSAHYDHLGLNPNLKGDQIFNGAADDGSGVVASLELAQTFMRAKRDGLGPRRSIMFVNFAGEEKGLVGSFHYAHRQPLIPFEHTVADINMDGVGGFDLKHPTQSKNYTYIVGAGELSAQLIAINKEVNKITGNKIELTDHAYFPSDQYNFQLEQVPFIYYSSGLTEHYHRVSDEPQTIDYEHLARVTQLIFATTWQIANQDEKITRVQRTSLKLVGYICPPCAFECDDVVHAHGGECPVCGMDLVPKYTAAGVNGD